MNYRTPETGASLSRTYKPALYLGRLERLLTGTAHLFNGHSPSHLDGLNSSTKTLDLANLETALNSTTLGESAPLCIIFLRYSQSKHEITFRQRSFLLDEISELLWQFSLHCTTPATFIFSCANARSWHIYRLCARVKRCSICGLKLRR